jgi:hypothetical protein
MTGRILNRRELRKQADEAEQPEAVAPDPQAAVLQPKGRGKGKTAATPKARKPRKQKVPPRLRARWGVFDSGMHQVAVFDYNQRAAAEEKLADLLAKKKGIHFLQIVKEPMPDPAPIEGPVAE